MTTRRAVLFALVLIAAALPLAAVDPALLRLVPAEATVVAGVNLEQAKASAFGQFILKKMDSEEEGLRKLMTATGFDPRRDLRELVVASTETTAQAKLHRGVVVASGVFDPARIIASARTEGAVVTNYAGVDILAGKEPHKGGLAFLDRSIAVAGDAEMVREAIDRHQKGGAGPSAALAAKATEWSGKSDAWVVVSGRLTDWARHVPGQQPGGMKIQGIEGIEQTAAGVKLGATVRVSAEALMRSEKDATALADVVRFLAGMVQLNRDKPGAEQFAPVLDSMELKTDARTVSIGFSVPEEQLEKMIQSGHGAGRKPAARTRATI